MKFRLVAAAALLLSALPFAPVPARSDSGLITCWYNGNKQYTGADSDTQYNKPGFWITGTAGDYTYAYTLNSGQAPSDCPKPFPDGDPKPWSS